MIMSENRGANANMFGHKFEKDTCVEEMLLREGITKNIIAKGKYGYYLSKKYDDTEIIYVTQTGMKYYFEKEYKIKIFRNPDEAYIIKTKNEIIIKILEKKEQKCDGSVETKLWSGPSLKREYEILLGKNFIVHYAYCLNKYLSGKFKSDNMKYKILKQILSENDIEILCGSDEEYYDKLNTWINKF